MGQQAQSLPPLPAAHLDANLCPRYSISNPVPYSCPGKGAEEGPELGPLEPHEDLDEVLAAGFIPS